MRWSQRGCARSVHRECTGLLAFLGRVAQLLSVRLHAMLDYQTFRRGALRYWEKRRLWYNLALILPTLLGYAPSEVSAAVGDPPRLSSAAVFGLFALSALGANICYSFAYALEFIFATEDPTSRWLAFGRRFFFVAGVLFAMMLAFIGGRNIHIMEYYYR